jgi:hypothetical protein
MLKQRSNSKVPIEVGTRHDPNVVAPAQTKTGKKIDSKFVRKSLIVGVDKWQMPTGQDDRDWELGRSFGT